MFAIMFCRQKLPTRVNRLDMVLFHIRYIWNQTRNINVATRLCLKELCLLQIGFLMRCYGAIAEILEPAIPLHGL